MILVNSRELNHDIIAILNLGGINHESSSVLAEDFNDEEDDEYEPNEEEDEGVRSAIDYGVNYS